MDAEILQLLKEIRTSLYILTAICVGTFLVWVVNWIGSIKANFRKASEDDFQNRADKYFEQANFVKLTELCKDKLSTYPNHTYAIWWLAKTKYEIGETAEAKKLFHRVLELAPGWKDTHIEPYLEKLKNEEASR